MNSFSLQSILLLCKKSKFGQRFPFRKQVQSLKTQVFQGSKQPGFCLLANFLNKLPGLKGSSLTRLAKFMHLSANIKSWKVKRNSLCNAHRERNYFCWITAIDSSFTYLCELPTAPCCGNWANLPQLSSFFALGNSS